MKEVRNPKTVVAMNPNGGAGLLGDGLGARGSTANVSQCRGAGTVLRPRFVALLPYIERAVDKVYVLSFVVEADNIQAARKHIGTLARDRTWWIQKLGIDEESCADGYDLYTYDVLPLQELETVAPEPAPLCDPARTWVCTTCGDQVTAVVAGGLSEAQCWDCYYKHEGPHGGIQF
jgi:hypothetical protein